MVKLKLRNNKIYLFVFIFQIYSSLHNHEEIRYLHEINNGFLNDYAEKNKFIYLMFKTELQFMHFDGCPRV